MYNKKTKYTFFNQHNGRIIFNIFEKMNTLIQKYIFFDNCQMENNPDLKELIEEIDSEFLNFKDKIETAKKMKGKKRYDYIQTVKEKDFKRIRTYINHLQTSINFSEEIDDQKMKLNKELVQKYTDKLQRYIKRLESSKNDVMTEEVLFEQRAETKKNIEMDRKQIIQDIDQAQLQSEQAVKRALKYMYEMQGIGQTVNVQLERQIEQLDSIYQTLQDTESSMNRAIRYINYFARSVYTDKILMALIVLIIIAIVVIIVLTSLGKLPSAKQDSLF